MSGILSRQRAFTLIELLIVVAIISILAAIAIPNYLEAQVRAKVGRVQADMRSVATAIETYRLDHDSYPITDWQTFPQWVLPGNDTTWETPQARIIGEDYGTVWRITTPIAYISMWPVDPFRNGTMTPDDGLYLDYYYWEGGWQADAVVKPLRPNLFYMVYSNGPDLAAQYGMEYSWDAHYDSTNGTISRGNIVRFGP